MERDEYLRYQEAELKARGKRLDEDPHPEDFFKEEVIESEDDEWGDGEDINWDSSNPEIEEIFPDETED
jgi:hypothetical protein